MNDRRLIVFARYPELGKAKTRLIPILGAETATNFHAALTTLTLDTCRELRREYGIETDVYFSGGDAAKMAEIFGDDFDYYLQVGNDLGERLITAIDNALKLPADRIAVIGTDCPDITAEDVKDALDGLTNHDVIIGPAADGGYYLIAVRQRQPILFQGIDWGTENVLTQTLGKVDSQGSKCQLLAELSDVDFAEDLTKYRFAGSGLSQLLPQATPGKMSIIIPTLNEESHLPRTLESIGPPTNSLEIIVCDAGSTDETTEIAAKYGCRVLSCNRGRGAQLNCAALISTGDVLLFLHADTILPENYARIIREHIDSGRQGGAFRLKIDSPGLGAKIVQWGANLRSRWLKTPYGDQGIFVHSDFFFVIGGFKNMPIMEDYEFICRANRYGRMGMLVDYVTTSARRWKKLGMIRTTLTNQACIIAYHFGVPAKRIAAWYRKKK